MEMTKEELQRRISELTEDLARGASESEHLKKTLEDAQRRMSVIDRPKVTQKFLNELSDAIENAVGNIDFDDTHAYEFDWADGMKVYEAIGQSLYYASETGKDPGIYLLVRKKNSEKHIRKVKRVIETFELPIKLVIKDIRN